MLKTVRSGSQFSGCPQSERTASVCEHGLGHVGVLYPFLTCFLPTSLPPTLPWLFQNPSPSSLQIRLPRLPEGLGDRELAASEMSVSGMIWRETRICVSFPFPQACPFAAMWVDLEHSSCQKNGQRHLRFPQIQSGKGLLGGIKN